MEVLTLPVADNDNTFGEGGWEPQLMLRRNGGTHLDSLSLFWLETEKLNNHFINLYAHFRQELPMPFIVCVLSNWTALNE